ncbi:CHAT domain-containing protein [Nocardioides sp. InS609-2]|uniref:CHAT domain-containing protein n=1 Tax=Nocardioides sp. InS609-2 TaxID=2760705 RepID=UPI0020BE74B8|nr:CHAT domain-containing protein [Nocardioides sp. InS609-2]
MPGASDEAVADALLLLAISDPAAAHAAARELAQSARGAWLQSVAHHAAGLALRQQGDVEQALPELRRALRLAVSTRDADRSADVRATLGAAYAMAGRGRTGLAQLDRAVAESPSPALRARVLMRRGYVLSTILGRHREALTDLERALEGVQTAGDRVWEARTLNNVSALHQALGDPDAAARAATRAERMFEREGLPVEAAQSLHNRAGVAFLRGDLPTSLRLFDEASARFERFGLDEVDLTLDRADVLLVAGLAEEAAQVAQDRLDRGGLAPTREADLRLRRAEALLAGADNQVALAEARTASRLFRKHGRDWFAMRAELVELRAGEALNGADRRTARRALDLARLLQAEGADEAVHAWLLVARLAPHDSAEALRAGAAYRTDHRLPLVRASGWLAQGLECGQRGDRRGVLAACRRGLDELDRHRATLGSSELRALASSHGVDLAELALQTALDGSPRRLLGWSERLRATSLAQPRVFPGADEVAGPVAALRDNARRLRAAREVSGDIQQLEVERRRIESNLRSRLRHASGADSSSADAFDAEALVAGVGEGSFVELVEIAGTLHALVVAGGRVRRHVVGPVADAERAAEAARFTLRQAARGRPAPLGEAGARLEHAVLGVAARRLPGPVVVSPTSRLHGAPWGLMPVLADVPHAVVPSGALWLRARERTSASDSRVFVAGPGLTTGGSEISVVAPRHLDAVVLRDQEATVDGALAALDGAGLAHLAAHGHFRADSPLFSSLDLADGPLTVYDFERLVRAPHRVILSACDSGVLAPVGAGELLGLVSALLAIGTAGVMASVAVVNDEATVEVMVDVHAGLDVGEDLPTALHRARTAAADDPTRAATAAAFLALGV